MYLSLNWLKDFIKIPSSITPEKLAEKMTLHTVEVDGVENQSRKFENIVVGKILEIKPHPNADRLQLAKVNIGIEKLNIVCGAPNIKEGQFVPVALIGAILPNGIEIKEAEVRGEKSSGMICAEDELGIGNDHAGIMILDKKAKAGEPFSKYLGLKDIIIEVDNKSITHRSDLWGHFGMAREISSFLEIKIKNEPCVDLLKLVKKNKIKKCKALKVGVKDEKLCPRYMAIKISGIEIKESPKWIQERLIAIGSRPINNIVDITNYVMFELGQPTHAFDADLVDEIIVRRAEKNEKIKTLDNEDRELDDNMLVIADSKKPIAIAGVMGGSNSELSDKTSSVILESANFNPISIRKTAQKFGLRTEAVMRFEKSLDPNLCEQAVSRTFELIKEVCPKAVISSELSDIKNFKINQGPIQLDLNWLNNRIGEKIEENKIIKILESLGFKIEAKKSKDSPILEVKIPTWRAAKDISIREDLLEEVARIYGYNNLKPSMPQVGMKSPQFNSMRLFERKIKEILSCGAKLSEVYNYSFVGEDQLTKLNINFDSHIRLANPIANHQTMLRQSLAPNLLKNIELNQAKYDKIDLFEIGSVYFNFDGDINKDDSGKSKLPYQEKRISIAIARLKSDSALNRAKGVVEYLFSLFKTEIEYEPDILNLSWAEDSESASIKVNNKEVGAIALLDKEIGKSIGLKKQVAIAEINLNDFYNAVLLKEEKKYKESAKYPPVIRDLAFVVDAKVLYNKIKKNIENFNKLIKKVELFDIYQGEKLGRNKKNLAFHIIYQSDRTLISEEIDNLQKELSRDLEKKFGAQIRDF